ncbi:hypothetical protein BSIN_5305 [Burkholderia singularis]|uniref:Uncharacterized protein n=1 Tax=Burkholderia singularis TaxID=1503053 RepID=A0A238HD81_9BURK|nr:hypothetical protein BSIN_5305 [Burkholderia singularis]
MRRAAVRSGGLRGFAARYAGLRRASRLLLRARRARIVFRLRPVRRVGTISHGTFRYIRHGGAL